MTLLLATMIGLLFASGAYMMLRRSFVKLIIGLGLLGHAANLLIITSAGVLSDVTGTRGTPPLIRIGEKTLAPGSADPLPPALILTAIVISFAILSFTIVLVKRTYQEAGTDDLDQMRTTDTAAGDTGGHLGPSGAMRRKPWKSQRAFEATKAVGAGDNAGGNR